VFTAVHPKRSFKVAASVFSPSPQIVRCHGVSRLEGLPNALETKVPGTQQVMPPTTASVFGGDTHAEGNLFSVSETSRKLFAKGKAAEWQEVRTRIIRSLLDYEVYANGPRLRAPRARLISEVSKA